MRAFASTRPLPWLFLTVVLGLLAACGKGEGNAERGASGPVIWTLPVQDNGKESITIDGRTVSVGTARGWETVEAAIEMMGTETLLRVELTERELHDWGVYSSALRDQELVIRIADVDLMILEGGPQLKSKGLWRVGPRETAEPRAQEVLKRLAEQAAAD